MKLFKNLKFKIKNSARGITLIEIIVVIFIITLFASIVIADFPRIKKQFALSRSAYRLAQDLRKVQDMGLSGLKITYPGGSDARALGYGIYINLDTSDNQYIIYADTCPPGPSAGGSGPDYMYDLPNNASVNANCNSTYDNNGDHIISTINVDPDGSGVYIADLQNIDGRDTSINFSPPNPDINIEKLDSNSDYVTIKLSLKSDNSSTKTITVTKAGLITVN